MPAAPIEKLVVLLLEGLVNLYPKLSRGGYHIIDYWGVGPACKQAVQYYLQQYHITGEIITIDARGMYWKKPEHSIVIIQHWLSR